MSAPIHIISLKTFPTMKAAFDASEKLSTLFKATHKRGEKVDLFLASSGDLNAPLVEIRVHFIRENEADARWLVETAKSL